MARTKIDAMIRELAETRIEAQRERTALEAQQWVAAVEEKASIAVTPTKVKLPIDYSIIAKGSSEEIRKLAEEYTTKEFRALMLETTCRGNNSLHLAAQFNTPEAIATILTLMGEEASTLAVQSNVEGMPPAVLLNKNKKLAEKGGLDRAASLMVPITKSAPTSELSELIDINKLLSERYPHMVSSPIKDNLVLAVQAVNETRQHIEASSTHLTVNLHGSREEIEHLREVNNKINSMRISASVARLFSFKETAELNAEYAIKAKVANCGELADMIYVNLKSKDFKSSSEVFYLNNADHVFNVIGRTPGSNPNGPTSWGENTVVADAWSGDVYLASELSSRLKGYRHIQYQGETHYYLEPFNPRFHKFTVFRASYPTEEKTCSASNHSKCIEVLPSATAYDKLFYQPELIKHKVLEEKFATAQKTFIEVESTSQRKLAELTSARERDTKANKKAIADAERRIHEIMNENKDANGKSYGHNPFGRVLSIITVGGFKQRWMHDSRDAHPQKSAALKKEATETRVFAAHFKVENNKLAAARADWATKLDEHHAEAVKLELILKSSALHAGYNGILSALRKEEKLSVRAATLADQTHSAYKQLHGESIAAERMARLTDLHKNIRGEYLAAVTSIPGRMIEDTIHVGGFVAHTAREGVEKGAAAVSGITEHFVTESDPFSDSSPVDPIRVTEVHAEVSRFLKSIGEARKTVASESRKAISSAVDLMARILPYVPRGGDDMDIGYAEHSSSSSSGAADTLPTPGTVTTPDPSLDGSAIEDDEIGYDASWNPN